MGAGKSPLPSVVPGILSRPTYVLTSPGWASVIRMESGNGWMGGTMRPTSSECLGFLYLLHFFSSAPPGVWPTALLSNLDSVLSVLPSWLFSSHATLPPQPGWKPGQPRMTFMGMGWAVRLVPISTDGKWNDVPAKDPAAGSRGTGTSQSKGSKSGPAWGNAWGGEEDPSPCRRTINPGRLEHCISLRFFCPLNFEKDYLEFLRYF